MKIPKIMWIAEWDYSGSRAYDIFWTRKAAVNFCGPYENVAIYPVEVRRKMAKDGAEGNTEGKGK